MASFVFEVENLNNIYIYDGPFETGERGYSLVKRAAAMYCMEAGFNYDMNQVEILKEERGKPYFADIPVEFSLTHSENLWMCMFSQKPCGLDLQVMKSCKYEAIATRNFTKDEQHYVTLWGLDGFFDVWVRKEAFCKYTGQGFFTEMPSMADGQSDLLDTVNWNGKTYFLEEIVIGDHLKCAVCTTEKTTVEIRSLV